MRQYFNICGSFYENWDQTSAEEGGHREKPTADAEASKQSNPFGSKATGLLYSSFCNLLDEK